MHSCSDPNRDEGLCGHGVSDPDPRVSAKIRPAPTGSIGQRLPSNPKETSACEQTPHPVGREPERGVSLSVHGVSVPMKAVSEPIESAESRCRLSAS
jgi:hypothetical protein